MALYPKLFSTICLWVTVTFALESQLTSDSIFFYIVENGKQKKEATHTMRLFVHNAHKDTISIDNFNQYIQHSSALYYKQKQERLFYWDLQTLSNQIDSNVVSVTPTPNTKSKQESVSNNVRIVIPPNSTFISDVYMLYPPFVFFPGRLYKLGLYNAKNHKCIAETIIELK